MSRRPASTRAWLLFAAAAMPAGGALVGSPQQAAAQARETLGVYAGWAAFRDSARPRCYAIAEPEEIAGAAQQQPAASFGFWPGSGIGGQLHVRLSRERSANSRLVVSIGNRRFRLRADRKQGWSVDAAMDRAILRAVRAANSMSVESVGRDGAPIIDAYLLKGAASAIDAAALGCLPR